MSEEVNSWNTLDELLGIEALAATAPTGDGVGKLAFYGRCSTEDNQDPRTSLAWQLGEAKRFVELLGGKVVAEFFDIGQSRSIPWERRERASEALAALKDPTRGWDGLVVGEATRCWYSTSSVSPGRSSTASVCRCGYRVLADGSIRRTLFTTWR